MDFLVASTSCPDKYEINDFTPMDMKYQVLEHYYELLLAALPFGEGYPWPAHAPTHNYR